MREVGYLLKCFHKDSKASYIHWINSDLIEDHRGESENWGGKVNEIKRQIMIEMTDKIEKLRE